MMVIRFLFGMGEAGAFPIATRSLSRWMLPSERGFAQGVTHAGSRLGAALTPPLVVLLITALGLARAVSRRSGRWASRGRRSGSGITATRRPSTAASTQAERDLIAHSLGGARPRITRIGAVARHSLQPQPVDPFGDVLLLRLLPHRLPRLVSDLPERRIAAFRLTQMGFYASLPLLAGTAGDLLGGPLSDWLAQRTGNLNLARRGVAIAGFLLAAAAIIPATLDRAARSRASVTPVSACSGWNSRSASPGPSRSISAAITPAPFPPS